MIGITVDKIMRKGLITARKTDSVEKIAKTLRWSKISRVVVTEKGKIVGIVTEKDIMGEIVAAGKSSKTQIGKIMKYPVKTVTPETDIEDALKTMIKYNISGLPVTSKGKPIGIVTERDMIRAEPGLLELVKERGNLEHIPPAGKEALISGECENCGNYSEDLKIVEGQLLCEDCR